MCNFVVTVDHFCASKQFEEESVKVGLRMDDPLCWSVGINQISEGLM